jgi:5-methylcytosine-specific restriction enzyme A
MALEALGGEASRRDVIAWAIENGGFDPARLAPTDAGRSLAEQDVTWALSRAVQVGAVERPERAYYRLAPDRRPQSNPDWRFDELILALDLYLRWRPRRRPDDHPDLIELSDVLRRLPIHPDQVRSETFRNPNGVRRKLGDFTDPDPSYTGTGTKGGRGVHLVWAQFADDPEALAAAVARIRASVTEEAPDLSPEEGEDEAVEGRILFREHRVRERDPRLARKKKQAALRARSRITCEVCGIDFQAVYGDLGAGFMECHHTLPLALGTVRTTTVDDLALVCSNCPRVLHKSSPMLTVEQLRALVEKARVQSSP